VNETLEGPLAFTMSSTFEIKDTVHLKNNTAVTTK